MGKEAPEAARRLARRRFDHKRSVIAGALVVLLIAIGLVAAPAWNRPLGPQLVQPTPAPWSTVLTPQEGTFSPRSIPTLPAHTPRPTSQPQCGGPSVMYLMLVGSDTQNTYSGFADVIRIARIDFASPSLTLLAVPRDLWVRIRGLETYGIIENRIKTAYSYGNHYMVPGGGPSLLAQTLMLNFGVQVDHYVIANFADFEAGIDAIGGIEIAVPEAITGDGYYFHAGSQHMNGRMALAYARIREDNSSDLNRIDRQTQVILAIQRELLNPETLPTLPRLVTALQDSVVTDLSPSEISMLLCLMKQIEPSAIRTVRIDESMVTSFTDQWGYEILEPDYDAIREFVRAFNAGTLPQAFHPF